MASTAAEIAPQFYTSNLEEDNNCLSAALIKFKFNMKSQSALDFILNLNLMSAADKQLLSSSRLEV